MESIVVPNRTPWCVSTIRTAAKIISSAHQSWVVHTRKWRIRSPASRHGGMKYCCHNQLEHYLWILLAVRIIWSSSINLRHWPVRIPETVLQLRNSASIQSLNSRPETAVLKILATKTAVEVANFIFIYRRGVWLLGSSEGCWGKCWMMSENCEGELSYLYRWSSGNQTMVFSQKPHWIQSEWTRQSAKLIDGLLLGDMRVNQTATNVGVLQHEPLQMVAKFQFK